MTIAVATNVKTDISTNAVQVKAGRYMYALGGTLGGATVEFNVNIGPARGVPVAGMAYTTNIAEIVWLPDCTCFVTVSGATGTTDISSALALVALDVE